MVASTLVDARSFPGCGIGHAGDRRLTSVAAMTGTIGESAVIGAESPPHRIGRWMMMVAVVIMLAGLLFGYDQGVIAGALHGIQQDFDISTTVTEIITSWVTLGALFGALVAGELADRWGRRITILFAAGLFTVGAMIEAFAPGPDVLIVGRLVVGFGVGVASVAAPLYGAEMAPARLRGRFVSMYQLAITIGIFIAYLVDQALTNSDSWRLMLGVSAVPGVLLLMAMWPMPESPRWLWKRGRDDDAVAALTKVEPDADIAAWRSEAEAALAEDANQASWGELFSPALRRPLMIGVGLAVFQQITGINAIIYYANEIFGAAGFDTPQEQAAATTWAIGAVNVLATFVAVIYVDRFGRKPLLQIGLVGMTLSLTVVGFCFLSLDSPSDGTTSTGTTSMAAVFTLVGLVVFIASFAFSLGPVVWTMINEIYPSRIRGRGVALATAANWGSAWLVSQFFLTLTDAIGQAGTFWLFAAFSVIAFVWITLRVPETKGKTLEEIERSWATT
jgi:MFS transporter, SP family, galactose:H+ symporter